MRHRAQGNLPLAFVFLHFDFRFGGVQNGKGVSLLLLQHLALLALKKGSGALGYPFCARCPV